MNKIEVGTNFSVYMSEIILLHVGGQNVKSVIHLVATNSYRRVNAPLRGQEKCKKLLCFVTFIQFKVIKCALFVFSSENSIKISILCFFSGVPALACGMA